MSALILKELTDNTIIFVLRHFVLRNNPLFLPTQLCCMRNYTQRTSLYLQRVSSHGQFNVFCVHNYKNCLCQAVYLCCWYTMRLRMRDSEFQTVLTSWPTWSVILKSILWIIVNLIHPLYRVSQEEWTKLRESVPYVKL